MENSHFSVSAVTAIKMKPAKWRWWTSTEHEVLFWNSWKQWSLMTWSSAVFFQNQIFLRRERHCAEWVIREKLHGPKNKQRLMSKHLTWSMPHQEAAWMTNMKNWRVISMTTSHLPSFCACNEVTLFCLLCAAIKLCRLHR